MLSNSGKQPIGHSMYLYHQSQDTVMGVQNEIYFPLNKAVADDTRGLIY